MPASLRARAAADLRSGCGVRSEHPKPQGNPRPGTATESGSATRGDRKPSTTAPDPDAQTRNTSPRIPSYRLHKPSGQAVVTLSGRDHYLGRHGTPESKAAYERLIATCLAGGRTLPASLSRGAHRGAAPGAAGFTLAELCDGFLNWAREEYRLPDGSVSREVENVRIAPRPLLELFFDLDASEFGPRSLLLYRQRLIDANLSRGVVNLRVGIVRRAFRWVWREEHIPARTFHVVLAVEGFERGLCGARDSVRARCTGPLQPSASLRLRRADSVSMPPSWTARGPWSRNKDDSPPRSSGAVT